MVSISDVCEQISVIFPDIIINPDDELDAVGIDSMTMVRLILQLESAFDIVLSDSLLGPETFRTPRSITKALNMCAD
ncbi:phosphopantetheine-binding protein [Klebsiella variicola]|uniref:phosphopantetheine-binding protein n=1 Tax=Klebsiella variicola TaxID=244366 RepID=UPI0010334B5F|nr:phosphopantetheine-binding protein [Klebsiella variicola]